MVFCSSNFTFKGQNHSCWFHSAVKNCECEWHHITWMITNNSLPGSQLKTRQRCNYSPLWQTTLSYNSIMIMLFWHPTSVFGSVGKGPVNHRVTPRMRTLETVGINQSETTGGSVDMTFVFPYSFNIRALLSLWRPHGWCLICKSHFVGLIPLLYRLSKIQLFNVLIVEN